MFLTSAGTSAAQAARAIARVVIMTAAKRIVRGKGASECIKNVEFTRGNRGDVVWEPPCICRIWARVGDVLKG